MLYRILVQLDDRTVYEYETNSIENAKLLTEMFEHLCSEMISYIQISRINND